MAAAGAADSAVFVTRLGSDTLVVERMVRTGNRVEAEVLMRTPSTTRDRWVMELSPSGQMQRLERTPLDPATGVPRQAGPQQAYERSGADSLQARMQTQAGTRTSMVAAPAATLPFIDMVHWPYEVALMRARAMSVDVVQQPLLTGSRTSLFAIGRVGGDSMTITHPSRGTMRVHVDATGRLLGSMPVPRRASSWWSAAHGWRSTPSRDAGPRRMQRGSPPVRCRGATRPAPSSRVRR